MAVKPKKTVRLLLLFLFFFALFSMRFIHLGADAPKDLDPLSPGYICDPGNYAFNARLKIVIGEWKIDDWSLNYIYITPLPHYISYLIFLFFGVGIAQMNVVPALFSSLILIFVYLILKKTLNPMFTLLGVLLLGVNYEFTMFSRVANRIMPMLFFACLTIYLLMLAENKKYVYYFLAGISCFLAFTAKATFLLVLPSVVLGVLVYTYFQNGKNLKTTLTSVGLFGLGMAIVFALWFWLFYMPNQKLFQDISADNIGRLSPSRLYWAVRNFWERPLYHLSGVPVVTCLTVLFLLFLAYAAFRTPRKIPLVGWVSGFWIITSYAYLSVVYYRPLRHDLPLLIPAILLATGALYELSRARYVQKPEKIPFPFYIFFFFWAVFTLSDLILLKFKPSSFASMQTYSFRLLAASLAVTVLVAVILEALPRRWRIPLPGFIKVAFIGGLVVVYLFFNLKPYFAWACSPRYDTRDISRDLGKVFKKMSIGGLSAPLMAMENQHIGHGFDYYIDERKDFLEKYNVTHLFIIPYFDEIRKYRDYYPEAMKKARLIARFSVWKTYFELWELNPALLEGRKDGDLYEGEIFYGSGGIPRFDPEASGRYAFVAEKNQEAIIELPRLSYPAGEYDVTFFLKAEDGQSFPGTLAKIEVVDSNTRKILASRRISGQDFSDPRKYRGFRLPLVLQSSTDIGFKVHSKGEIALSFDKVSVHKPAKRTPRGQVRVTTNSAVKKPAEV